MGISISHFGMSSPGFRGFRIFAGAMLGLSLWAAVPGVHAANVTWSGATSPGNWNVDTFNWSSGSVPTSSDIAVFSSTNSAQIVRGNGAMSINGLVFSNSVSTAIEGGNAAGGGSNSSMAIGSGGITLNAGAGAVTLGNGTTPFRLAVSLVASQTWANNSSSTLTKTGAGNNGITLGGNTLTIAGSGNTSLNPVISGSGAIVKIGTGTLSLTAGVSTYTGATTVTMGSMILSGAASINATSELSVASGATVTNNSSTSFTQALSLAEGAVINGSGAFAPVAMTITANLTTGFTTFALGSASLLKAGNLELTLSGITSGTYTLFSGGTLSGSYATMTVGGVSLVSGGSGNFSGLVGGVNYTYTNASNQLIVAVPEPSAMAFATFALTIGVIFRLRRSRRA